MMEDDGEYKERQFFLQWRRSGGWRMVVFEVGQGGVYEVVVSLLSGFFVCLVFYLFYS